MMIVAIMALSPATMLPLAGDPLGPGRMMTKMRPKQGLRQVNRHVLVAVIMIFVVARRCRPVIMIMIVDRVRDGHNPGHGRVGG